MPQQIPSILSFRIEPTLTGAYAAGDQLGGLLTLSKATYGTLDNAGTFKTLSVINFANIATGFRLHFFSEAPTLAGDNAPFSISTAEARTKWLGYHELTNADFGVVQFGGSRRIATLSAVDLEALSTALNTVRQYSTDLFVALEATRAMTFTAPDDLHLILNFNN